MYWSNLVGWASFKVFLNLTWQPFESGFYDIQVKFMNHAQIVTREAQVRGFIDDYSERQRIKLREDLEDKERKGRYQPIFICRVDISN